jgi:plastocyanin
MRRVLLSLLCIPHFALANAARTPESFVPTPDPNRTATIAIDNFTFVPNTLTIPAGTELVWINQDDVPHIVIGTDGASPIKSQPLDTDDRYFVTISKPGTYKYFCSLHPHMVGTIVVQSRK